MAHRHDQQRVVVAVDAELDLGHEREQRHAAVARGSTPLGLPVVPEVYISVQGSSGGDLDSGSASLAAASSVLVAAPAGRRTLAAPKWM